MAANSDEHILHVHKKAIQLIKVHLGDLKDLHDDALLLVLVPF